MALARLAMLARFVFVPRIIKIKNVGGKRFDVCLEGRVQLPQPAVARKSKVPDGCIWISLEAALPRAPCRAFGCLFVGAFLAAAVSQLVAAAHGPFANPPTDI